MWCVCSVVAYKYTCTCMYVRDVCLCTRGTCVHGVCGMCVWCVVCVCGACVWYVHVCMCVWTHLSQVHQLSLPFQTPSKIGGHYDRRFGN